MTYASAVYVVASSCWGQGMLRPKSWRRRNGGEGNIGWTGAGLSVALIAVREEPRASPACAANSMAFSTYRPYPFIVTLCPTTTRLPWRTWQAYTKKRPSPHSDNPAPRSTICAFHSRRDRHRQASRQWNNKLTPGVAPGFFGLPVSPVHHCHRLEPQRV
jgi:hypothetical protein